MTLEEAYEKIKSFEKLPILYQKLIVVIEELLLEKIRMQGGKE